MAMVKQILARVLQFIPAPIMNFIRGHKELVFIVMIGILAFAAFEGYRVVRGCIYAGAGIGLAGGAYLLVGKLFPVTTIPVGPNQIHLIPIIALLCGVIGVLVVKFAYKVAVFFVGGAVGFALGYFFIAEKMYRLFQLGFLNTKLAFIVFGVVFALLLGILFVLFFKHICMVGSGVGCMAAACFLAGKLIMPTMDKTMMLCFILVGVIGGILCTVYQYKVEERANEIVF